MKPRVVRIERANPTPFDISRMSTRRTHGRVIRSAHLGNISTYNLAGAAGSISPHAGQRKRLGVTLQLYDRTVPVLDQNNIPGSIVFQGRRLDLFPTSQRLTPFTFLDAKKRQEIATFLRVSISRVPHNLATLHYRMAQRAAGKSRVHTYSQYLESNKGVVKSVLNHLVRKEQWDIFDRYVDNLGVVHAYEGTDANFLLYANGIRVKKSGVVRNALRANHLLTQLVVRGRPVNRDIGVLLSIETVALLQNILEASKHRSSSDVYHASGSTYMHYATENQAFRRNFGRLAQAMEDYSSIPLDSRLKIFSLLPMQLMSPRQNTVQVALLQRLARLIRHKVHLVHNRDELILLPEKRIRSRRYGAATRIKTLIKKLIKKLRKSKGN